MKLSIVTTLYKSAPYINEFYERITSEAVKITDDYELIFVNDGSPDNSLEIAVDIHRTDDKVKIVDLSRNFGHHKAIMTGLEKTEGEIVFLIDCDLEEPPELFGEMYQRFIDNDFDVIFGVQKDKRKGRFFEKITGEIFYFIYNKLCDEAKVPQNLCTVRIMNRNYVNAMGLYREKEFYLAPICSLAGFRQKGMKINKLSKGRSSYGTMYKYHLFINSTLSFSTKPLFAMFYLGALITFLSIIYTFFLIFKKIVWGVDASGWTTLMVSVWFLGGVTIFFVGLLAIYLSKIFVEVKDRPFTIIKKIYS